MSDRIGYVVVAIEASGEAQDTLPGCILHFDQADAEFERDNRNVLAEDDGRPVRYVVYELTEAAP